MKYIVAIKYEDSDDLLSDKTEIFEFNNKKDRGGFVKSIRHLAKEYAFTQIDEPLKVSGLPSIAPGESK